MNPGAIPWPYACATPCPVLTWRVVLRAFLCRNVCATPFSGLSDPERYRTIAPSSHPHHVGKHPPVVQRLRNSRPQQQHQISVAAAAGALACAHACFLPLGFPRCRVPSAPLVLLLLSPLAHLLPGTLSPTNLLCNSRY
eukprot:3563668-Rhodomonas_salina.5